MTKPSFRELISREDKPFVMNAEVLSTRAIGEEAGRVRELAKGLSMSASYDTVSFTDNPGGGVGVSPSFLVEDVMAAGGEPIVHLTCKDRNRAGLESLLRVLANKDANNVLALTGDAPARGRKGFARKSFDLDSVTLIALMREMNEGLIDERGGKTYRLKPANFMIGGAVNPFKLTEAEQMTQYYKALFKIEQGAHFLATQLGYDSRKYDELLRYFRLRGADVPVLAGVYLLSAPVAKAFRDNKIPGCIASDGLVELAEGYATGADKGKGFFVELAAKQIAIARGLGYRGAHVGGAHNLKDFEAIASAYKSFGPDDWKVFAKEISFGVPGQFYIFEQDPETGLNTYELERSYAASLSPEARERIAVPMLYRLSTLMHDAAFEPGTAGYNASRRFFEYLETRPRLEEAARRGEKAIKALLYDCRDCGDCSLDELGYRCPVAGCGKNQRNGPCGGSFGDKCEVLDITCLYVDLYSILKSMGEEESMLQRKPIINDWGLEGTSGWANYFLQRGHQGD